VPVKASSCPAHHFIESPSQTPAGSPPTAHLPQSKGRCPAELARVEILVRDRVAPVIELLEVAPAMSIPHLVAYHFGPEVDAKPTEICPEACGLGVPAVEVAAARELRLQQRPDRWRRCQGRHQGIDAFRMKVAAEPLELGRQQDCVGLVNLLGRKTTAALGAAHGRMRTDGTITHYFTDNGCPNNG
jgi:hypothetical protein